MQPLHDITEKNSNKQFQNLKVQLILIKSDKLVRITSGQGKRDMENNKWTLSDQKISKVKRKKSTTNKGCVRKDT